MTIAFQIELIGIKYRAISEHFVPEGFMAEPIRAIDGGSGIYRWLESAYNQYTDEERKKNLADESAGCVRIRGCSKMRLDRSKRFRHHFS